MVKISVRNTVPNQLRVYAAAANKAIGEAVKEECKFLLQRLIKLFPPKNRKEGANAVERDFRKVYLANSWFLQKFNFKNQTFGDRVKNLVRTKDQQGLTETFSKSGKLSQIHVEPFNESVISKLRKNGRVGRNIKPLSFPVKDERKVKAAMKEKQKAVGMVKSGWANCLKVLGFTGPAWLKQTGTGNIVEDLMDKNNPSITLINSVKYAGNYQRLVEMAQQGRAKDLEKKTKMALERLRQSP